MKTSPMDMQALILLVMIGLAAGVLSGLVGVGGGIILVPSLIYFFNYNQLQAQGTSLGILTFPVTIIAFLMYYKNCQETGSPIHFKVIGVIALAFLAGSYFGGMIASKIDELLLKRLFAILLFYTGIKMLGWDDFLFRWLKNILS
jgi:uncharacterized membrane protein YfcA